MTRPSSTHRPDQAPKGQQVLERVCQVVLFNDDHNSMEYVVLCLMHVFGYPLPIAAKVMFEAHSRGKSIAEVENEASAHRHQVQLSAHGLTSEVESI